MLVRDILTDDRIALRCLGEADCTEDYVAWLNDPVVNEFSGRRGRQFTLSDVVTYVNDRNASPTDLLMGMFWKAPLRHVGNILLSEIDWTHRHAEHSRLLGDRAFWGMGIGRAASRLLIHYAFSVLGLERITAGHLVTNRRAMASNAPLGFQQEGLLREHLWHDGRFVDVVRFGLLRQEFYAHCPELRG